MALMSAVVLELAFALGAVTKNKGLTATALQLFLYVLVVLLVMFLVMSGKAFYQKLRNETYYPTKMEQGYSSYTLLGGLTLMYSLFLFGLAVIPGNYLWIITIFIVLIYIFAGLFLFQQRVDTNMIRYGATEWKLWRILITSFSILLCIVLFVINVVLTLQI